MIIITEKRWYVTNGLHYLGPYSTQEEAHAVRRRACPSGCVELLDPLRIGADGGTAWAADWEV